MWFLNMIYYCFPYYRAVMFDVVFDTETVVEIIPNSNPAPLSFVRIW